MRNRFEPHRPTGPVAFLRGISLRAGEGRDVVPEAIGVTAQGVPREIGAREVAPSSALSGGDAILQVWGAARDGVRRPRLRRRTDPWRATQARSPRLQANGSSASTIASSSTTSTSSASSHPLEHSSERRELDRGGQHPAQLADARRWWADQLPGRAAAPCIAGKTPECLEQRTQCVSCFERSFRSIDI
jgi:hypothetical protein